MLSKLGSVSEMVIPTRENFKRTLKGSSVIPLGIMYKDSV